MGKNKGENVHEEHIFVYCGREKQIIVEVWGGELWPTELWSMAAHYVPGIGWEPRYVSNTSTTRWSDSQNLPTLICIKQWWASYFYK